MQYDLDSYANDIITYAYDDTIYGDNLNARQRIRETLERNGESLDHLADAIIANRIYHVSRIVEEYFETDNDPALLRSHVERRVDWDEYDAILDHLKGRGIRGERASKIANTVVKKVGEKVGFLEGV